MRSKLSLSRIRIAKGGAIALAGLCIQVGALAAGTPKTWRCGNTYTDRPCQDGTHIDAGAAPDAARKREADQATRDARSAADRMERDRERLEAAGNRRGATVIDYQRTAQARPHQDAAVVLQRPKKAPKDPTYASWQQQDGSAGKQPRKPRKSSN